MAQVTHLLFRFGTRRTAPGSPAPRSAAASATDAVPVAANGTADGCGTATPASSSLPNARTGTPSSEAAPVIPGSPARASSVASAVTSAPVSPASRSVAATRPSTSEAAAPDRAPTPTTTTAGTPGPRCGKEGGSDSKGPWL